MDIREFGLLVCAPVRICKPNYWSWQVNTNWFYHPAFGSGYQIWFWRPVVKLIKTDCKHLNRLSYQILLENTFGLWKGQLIFHYLLFFCCLYYHCFFLSVANNGLTSERRSSKSRSSSLKQRQHLYCHVVIIRVLYWIPFFPNFSITVCWDQYQYQYPVRSVSWYCCAVPSRFGLLFGALWLEI
jgi:hypothetical protein